MNEFAFVQQEMAQFVRDREAPPVLGMGLVCPNRGAAIAFVVQQEAGQFVVHFVQGDLDAERDCDAIDQHRPALDAVLGQ